MPTIGCLLFSPIRGFSMKRRNIVCLMVCAAMTIFPALPAVASIACYQCHGTSGPADYRPLDGAERDPSSGGFLGNHRTHLGAPASAGACDICHPGSGAYGSAHSTDRSRKIKVASHINNSPLITPYNNRTSAFPQTSTPTPGTCENVNCHFESETPTWGTSGFVSPGNCGKCHGAAPADGSHPRHATVYGTPGVTNSCLKCHADHRAEANPFAHATSAGNRGLIISFAAAPNNGSGSYSGDTSYPNYLPSSTPARNGTCTNLYCHSNGTSTIPAAPNITATWGSTLNTTCSGCHGGDIDADYKMGNVGSVSHTKHVLAYTYGCVKCHAATVSANRTISNNANHANRQVNIAFNNSTTAVNGTYAGSVTPMGKLPGSAYGTCTNTYCHSTVQADGGIAAPVYGTPTWGNNPGACSLACHRVGDHDSVAADGSPDPIATGSHTKHLSYAFNLGSDAKCPACHMWDPAPVTTSCRPCHEDIWGQYTENRYTKHVNGKIDIAFDPNFTTGKYGNIATPMSKAPRTGYSACGNTYCHSNGTSVATGAIPANTSPVWGSGPLACNGCHGNQTYTDWRKAYPLYTTNRPTTKANSHAIHAQHGATCKQCHVQVTTDNTSIADTSKHVSKSYDVSPDTAGGITFTYTYNSGGGTCTNISCHGNTTAQWGSGACLGCHSITQGKRAAITSQFGGNSHHIQGTLSNAACYQCHWEADSNGYINPTYHGGAAAPGAAVDLVIYGAGSRPASYTAGATYVAYSANSKRAQIQKISTHCQGCHSDQNNSATPFGDGKTPKQYAWDGTSVASRYAQAGTVSWGKYTSASFTNVARKRITKAYSAHGKAGANKRYWDAATGVDGDMTGKDTSGSINVQCYDCHNSHGSTVSGITSRYSSATGRYKGAILKDTVRGFGGYSTTYKPRAGGSVARKNLRNPGASLCLDCHQSATPKQALAFRGYTTPWGYSSTYGATQAIIGYWDSPFMGYSSASAGPKQRFAYKGVNLTMGGHFGASSALNSPPDANHQINGLCTPCHDPHGVSTTLNQPYSVPLLKGTWLTSPYKEDVTPANNVGGTIRTDKGQEGVQYHIDQNTFGSAPNNSAVTGITQTDAQSDGLCLNCHAKANLTNGTTHTWKSKDRVHEAVKGWKTANTNYQHNYTCSKCHSPHTSSVLPRLMVTDCLDGVHKGRFGKNPGAVLTDTGTGSYDNDGTCTGQASYLGNCAWGNNPGTVTGYIPGYYSGTNGVSNLINCHEGNTGSRTNQQWNSVTPWSK